MIILLSPSKGMNTRDYERNDWINSHPSELNISASIAKHFKKWDEKMFEKEMGLSEKLALETFNTYKNWKKNPTSGALQAIFAYQGDVYGGLEARYFSKDELDFANNHLRIISGLYGLLKPSDMIMEYRLEIGFSKEIESVGKLYTVWKPLLAKQIKKDLKGIKGKIIIDLTSKEYAKAIDFKSLSEFQRIEFEFYEKKGDQLVFASFNSKRARGLMANFIIKNRINNLEALKSFNLEKYVYSHHNSTESKFVFIR